MADKLKMIRLKIGRRTAASALQPFRHGPAALILDCFITLICQSRADARRASLKEIGEGALISRLKAPWRDSATAREYQLTENVKYIFAVAAFLI